MTFVKRFLGMQEDVGRMLNEKGSYEAATI
jgi:hypothetical protein